MTYFSSQETHKDWKTDIDPTYNRSFIANTKLLESVIYLKLKGETPQVSQLGKNIFMSKAFSHIFIQ